jgi:hypothetical protein
VGTDEQGRFRLGGLLERDYSLRVMDMHTLEVLSFGPFRPGEESVEIVFPEGELTRIAGRVVAHDGRALAGVGITVRGNTHGGIWLEAGTTVSDVEGRFVFDRIGRESAMLAVSGADVVPQWIPVALRRGGESEVELRVSVRCNFQVDLGLETARADALRVLDGEGATMTLYRIGANGTFSTEQFPILDGRSDSLGVDDRARTLVLLKDGVEVLRVPLDLRPGALNRLVP